MTTAAQRDAAIKAIQQKNDDQDKAIAALADALTLTNAAAAKETAERKAADAAEAGIRKADDDLLATRVGSLEQKAAADLLLLRDHEARIDKLEGTPPPVDPPPVDPPPTGAPFPPPVTTRTVTAPAPSGGDDFARLNDFIATVPDGSVIVFPAGTYKLSQGVMLGTRSNLVFQLGTAVFQLTNPDRSQHTSSAFIPGYSYQSRSFVSGGSHLKFVGGTVIGGDPNPGAPQPLRGENQHAVRANGTNFIEVTGMTVKAVSGDHVFLHGCNDVWVHHNHVITAGRNCVSVISGARVLVEDNQHDRCGYVTFDIEPNFATESSTDIIYRRNTAGSWGLDWVSVDGGARGADIRRVTIADNTTTDALDLHIDNKGGTNGNTAARMKDVSVTGNKGGGTPAGPRLFFGRIDGVTVKGNTQALSSGQLSAFTLCTGIVQS